MRRVTIPTSLLLLVVLGACNNAQRSGTPSVTFTKLPEFGPGSSMQMQEITGRTTGAKEGEKIVLYARSGDWWIQPVVEKPFTTVEKNSSWKNQTHPGTAYAALLVTPDYKPSVRSDLLPETGGPILAVATAEGPTVEQAHPKTIIFGGYQWEIRQGFGEPGGTPNKYDPANVWLGKDGRLHLRIAGSLGHWTSAEVTLKRSPGYGSYRLALRDVSKMDLAAVFTMSVVGDGPSNQMDIEVSKWGETFTRNGQFVIQPYYIPANTVQFAIAPGPVTFLMRWNPGRAEFHAIRGITSNWESNAIRKHVFTSGVLSPRNESVRMSLYVFGNKSNPLRLGTEVIVDSFEYLP